MGRFKESARLNAIIYMILMRKINGKHKPEAEVTVRQYCMQDDTASVMHQTECQLSNHCEQYR